MIPNHDEPEIIPVELRERYPNGCEFEGIFDAGRVICIRVTRLNGVKTEDTWVKNDDRWRMHSTFLFFP